MTPERASAAGRELFARHARKDGRSVVVLRAVDEGASCIVEVEVFQPGSPHPSRPGPYRFADDREAAAFVSETLEALMYLGCDVQLA